MPELPDLDVVADALHAALAGRPVLASRAPMPLTVRGTPAELAALTGQRLARVARAGKFLDLELERDRVVVNPMLTGRFQLAGRGEKAPAGVAVELGFGPRDGGPPADAAAVDRRSAMAAGRRRGRRSCATATRRRWARSTCCPQASSGRSRAGSPASWDPTRSTRR